MGWLFQGEPPTMQTGSTCLSCPKSCFAAMKVCGLTCNPNILQHMISYYVGLDGYYSASDCPIIQTGMSRSEESPDATCPLIRKQHADSIQNITWPLFRRHPESNETDLVTWLLISLCPTYPEPITICRSFCHSSTLGRSQVKTSYMYHREY